MNITISIHYIKNDNKVLQRGTFPVNEKRYKENEPLEASRVAKDFLEDIKREIGNIEIEKITYNGSNDITDLLTPYF